MDGLEVKICGREIVRRKKGCVDAGRMEDFTVMGLGLVGGMGWFGLELVWCARACVTDY